MSFEKIKSVEHCFTSSQRNAILCVLPLISYQRIVTPKMRKGLADASAKLMHCSTTFRTLEFEAIVSAVELSILLMSGKAPELKQRVLQDAEWFEEIKSNYFVLNDLRQQFHQIAAELGIDI